MPRPTFLPTELPTEAERRERAYEMEWLTDLDQPSRPERNRGRSGYEPATKPRPPDDQASGG